MHRMREQEGANGLCFMSREIVGDRSGLPYIGLDGYDKG